MPVIEPVIRPPSEADSFLLQVTLGCSSDTCRFCGAYRSKRFSLKDEAVVMADIAAHARRHKDTRRVFLMDGDALVLPHKRLLSILAGLEAAFPRLARVSTYANGSNITRKSDGELEALRQKKLSLVYMGLESGSQAVLSRMDKVSRVDEMVEAVKRCDKAGIKSSVIVLLGLGGRELSTEHVAGTIDALNRMQPRYLSFLSLMVIPGTPLAADVDQGVFTELGPIELLAEAAAIIRGLELTKTIFRSDHASNHLPLEGVFPRDKEDLLRLLDAAVNGELRLRPEAFRGL